MLDTIRHPNFSVAEELPVSACARMTLGPCWNQRAHQANALPDQEHCWIVSLDRQIEQQWEQHIY